MFLEISQNSHENTCVRASFLIKNNGIPEKWEPGAHVGRGTRDPSPRTRIWDPPPGTRNRDPVYGTPGIQQIPVNYLPSTTINPTNSIANFSNSSFTFEKYPVTTDSSLLIFGSE